MSMTLTPIWKLKVGDTSSGGLQQNLDLNGLCEPNKGCVVINFLALEFFFIGLDLHFSKLVLPTLVRNVC